MAAGADINVRDGDGRTPLHHAVQHNRDEILKMLMEAGADPYIRANDGATANWMLAERERLAARAGEEQQAAEPGILDTILAAFSEDTEADRAADESDALALMTNNKAQADNHGHQPIQDFNIQLRSNNRIQVCARDHQCNGGDTVRISINGDKLFERELFHAPYCKAVTASPDRIYAIELHAVNGTGHRGDCSNGDSNKGQLTITSGNSQTHPWSHTGGTASQAKIIVRK